MRSKKAFIGSLLVIPPIFLIGAATSSPPWKMNSPVGQSAPFLVLVAGAVAVLATVDTKLSIGHQLMRSLGVIVLVLLDALVSAGLCLMIWGGIA